MVAERENDENCNFYFEKTTFIGRFKYYAWMTDPRTVFQSKENLLKAKDLVEQSNKDGFIKVPSEELKYALKLYSSAFHPDTGDLQNLFGRMSFQVPGGMLITGGMLAFYRTVPSVVLWQFINQSFNAIVNYTNRNANSPTTVPQLAVAYVSASTSALVAAIGFKSYLTKKSSSIFQRYVPLAAVAVANCVNIPLMRQNELIYGIDVKDDDGNIIGRSRMAALKGISQVVISRILMAAPGMLVLPILMDKIESYAIYKRYRWLNLPFQTAIVGCFLVFMVPAACALFPQSCSLSTKTMELLEADFYRELKDKTDGRVPLKVFFNKGL